MDSAVALLLCHLIAGMLITIVLVINAKDQVTFWDVVCLVLIWPVMVVLVAVVLVIGQFVRDPLANLSSQRDRNKAKRKRQIRGRK